MLFSKVTPRLLLSSVLFSGVLLCSLLLLACLLCSNALLSKVLCCAVLLLLPLLVLNCCSRCSLGQYYENLQIKCLRVPWVVR